MSDGSLSPPTGPAHSFVFVHEAVRSLLYDLRDQFVDDLRGPEGQAHLKKLWRAAGEVVTRNGIGTALPDSGLSSEAVNGDGWRGAVIHMPPGDKELGECCLVLVAVPEAPARGGLWGQFQMAGAPLARMFVSKLLDVPQGGTPEYKICELSPIMGHVTTGYSAGPNAPDFVGAVIEHLELE